MATSWTIWLHAGGARLLHVMCKIARAISFGGLCQTRVSGSQVFHHLLLDLQRHLEKIDLLFLLSPPKKSEKKVKKKRKRAWQSVLPWGLLRAPGWPCSHFLDRPLRLAIRYPFPRKNDGFCISPVFTLPSFWRPSCGSEGARFLFHKIEQKKQKNDHQNGKNRQLC